MYGGQVQLDAFPDLPLITFVDVGFSRNPSAILVHGKPCVVQAVATVLD